MNFLRQIYHHLFSKMTTDVFALLLLIIWITFLFKFSTQNKVQHFVQINILSLLTLYNKVKVSWFKHEKEALIDLKPRI